MKKIKSKQVVSFRIVIITVLILIIVGSLTWYFNYQNYKSKMVIISTMLTGEEQGKSNLLIASELLKGDAQISDKMGKDILQEYGYLSGYTNQFKREFYSNWIQSILVFLILAFSSLLLLYLYQRWWKHSREIELGEIEKLMNDFRNGNYDIGTRNTCSNKDDLRNHIYKQFESLGDYLKLVKENTIKEKEETKSLVTDISHQLKTPLAALKTSFEILQTQKLEPEERKEFLNRCELQLKGLEGLLAAFINISRMETGMIEIKKEEGCVFDTLVSAVNSVYQKAEEKHIEFDMEIEPELERMSLPHDSKWLREAIINLLDNAIKYSDMESTITIRMRKRTTFLRIEIADQGIGIPKEEYHKVFKRFYRGQSQKVKQQSGSGIGLYLSREIITRHGGTITVTSGKVVERQEREKHHPGCTFTIQLPYVIG